jgi:hypothetical protein
MLTFSLGSLAVELPEPDLNDIKATTIDTRYHRSESGKVRSYNIPQDNVTRLLTFSAITQQALFDLRDFISVTSGEEVALESDILGTLTGYIMGSVHTLENVSRHGGSFSLKFKET